MPRNCSIWASMEISSSSMKSKSTSRRPPPGPVWSPPLGKNTTALIHKHFHNDKDPFFFSFSDRLIFPCFFRSLNLHRETKQWTTEQLHGSTLCTTSSLCPQSAPLTPPPPNPLYLFIHKQQCSEPDVCGTPRCRKILPSTPQRVPDPFGPRVSGPPAAGSAWRRPGRAAAVTGHAQWQLA